MNADDIKKQVDELSLSIWKLVCEKSQEIFPETPRSAWIFRGRIYQSLYANHFLVTSSVVDKSLEEDEQRLKENP